MKNDRLLDARVTRHVSRVAQIYNAKGARLALRVGRIYNAGVIGL